MLGRVDLLPAALWNAGPATLDFAGQARELEWMFAIFQNQRKFLRSLIDGMMAEFVEFDCT